jgi:hypothetical protein
MGSRCRSTTSCTVTDTTKVMDKNCKFCPEQTQSQSNLSSIMAYNWVDGVCHIIYYISMITQNLKSIIVLKHMYIIFLAIFSLKFAESEKVQTIHKRSDTMANFRREYFFARFLIMYALIAKTNNNNNSRSVIIIISSSSSSSSNTHFTYAYLVFPSRELYKSTTKPKYTLLELKQKLDGFMPFHYLEFLFTVSV